LIEQIFPCLWTDLAFGGPKEQYDDALFFRLHILLIFRLVAHQLHSSKTLSQFRSDLSFFSLYLWISSILRASSSILSISQASFIKYRKEKSLRSLREIVAVKESTFTN